MIAYKLYEAIEARDENYIFKIRHQIIYYATIYKVVIHHILFEYYSNTSDFYDLQYPMLSAKISIPQNQKEKYSLGLLHNGEEIIPYHMQLRKKDEIQIIFDDKCKTVEKLGLLHSFKALDGTMINLINEIIEIYGYRNAIHLVAEIRKVIEYELNLSKMVYKRMRPFIDQIKEQLQKDKKVIYR